MRTIRNRTNNIIEITSYDKTMKLAPRGTLHISNEEFEENAITIQRLIGKRIIDDLGITNYALEKMPKFHANVTKEIKESWKDKRISNDNITEDEVEVVEEPIWHKMNKTQLIAFSIGQNLKINISRHASKLQIRETVRDTWRAKQNEED